MTTPPAPQPPPRPSAPAPPPTGPAPPPVVPAPPPTVPPQGQRPQDQDRGRERERERSQSPRWWQRLRPGTDEDGASTRGDLGDLRPLLWRWTNRGVVVGVIGIVVVVISLVVNYRSFLGIGVALLAVLAVETLMVSLAPHLRIRRHVDPMVVERHGDCHATVQVGHRGMWLVRTRVTDRAGRQRINVDIGGDEVSYRVPTLRRGLLQIGPMAVHRVGVFGLAMATQETGEIEHVRVLPRRVPLHQLARGRRRSAVGADESVEHGGTDLTGLHEYVPGDDLRRLHWATSARTGQLMIRDDADPSTPHLTIILDDREEHYGDHSLTDTDFEDAVEVAFALASTAIDQGHPLHLVSTSGALDVPVSERLGAAASDARRVQAALAEVQTTAGDAHMRLPKRTLDSVAVISGALAPLADLGSYASRGANGLVLVVDTSGGAPVSTGAGTGGVTVLRGPRSRDLAQLWDRTVR